jgi:hypothetical protein
VAKVYAYAVIAGTEKDEDENSPTFGQDVRVDYEPGTEITNKFPRDVLRRMLQRGTAALYDRTKTPEEAAEIADAENAQLRAENEKLKAQLEAERSRVSGQTQTPDKTT